MQKVEINPSIAAIVNINSVGYSELAYVYFKAATPWVGTFEYKVWNSFQKNIAITVANAIMVVGDLMTLKIDASNQSLPADKYYYEISSVDTKRIIFKGELIITK
jgi:hypothetical protein